MPKKKAPSERACARLARRERQAIERMPDRGKGCREVAREMGRAPSTVADEAESRLGSPARAPPRADGLPARHTGRGWDARPGARRRARASSRARPHGRVRCGAARARRARPDAGARGARPRRWGRGAAGGVAPRGQPNRVRGTRRAEPGSGARRVGGARPSDPSRRPATNPTPAGTCAGGPFRCLPPVSLAAETRRSLRLFR